MLQKCLSDSDDEVRERAFFYINLLAEKGDEGLLQTYANDENADGLIDLSESTGSPDGAMEKQEVREFVFD